MTNTKKRVLVTGGSRGIGKAISTVLLENGYQVEILAKEIGALKQTSKELGGIPYYCLDLANTENVSKFTNSWQGEIYGLVNNAGVFRAERIDSISNEVDYIMAVNFFGLYYLTKGLVKYIKNKGRIVNISSQLAFAARDGGCGPYGASKAAVNMLTKNWARELGPRGITVNSVCPCWTITSMSDADIKRIAEIEGSNEKEYLETITSKIELRRFNPPEEVARVVAFFLSEESSGITGQTPLMNQAF